LASIFSHGFVAIALGRYLGYSGSWWKLWAWSVLCSIIPDLDVISFALGIPYEHPWGHRGMTHSLFFAVILSICVVRVVFSMVPVGSRDWWKLCLHFFLVTASHGLLDAMTNGGLGVAFFAPFDEARYFLPWTPIEVSPIGVSGFFSEWGLRVVISELIWIWAPVTAFFLVFVGWQRGGVPARY
jgi:inner membrane protein